MNDQKRNVVIETCQECGEDFERPVGRRKSLCFSCKIGRFEDNLNAQKSRSGPIYEKTVRRQLLYWRREAKRLRIRA